MGETVTLDASDGHKFSAYRAEPTGPAKGGVVVIQEIFGVNAHIRSVADKFAAAGYVALAPAIFDRIEPGFETGYGDAELQAAFAMMKKYDAGQGMADIGACVAALRPTGKVAVVGFCLGGSMAYLSASAVEGVDAAVGYYGGMIAKMLDKKPKAPVMLHFGQTDASIPSESVAAVKAAYPDMPIYEYPAGHAFNRDADPNAYHAQSAELAWQRTLDFIEKA